VLALAEFYRVDPEVAGDWGENTVFTKKPGKAAVVHKLHYEFKTWLGDELLESTPCFIVSEHLAQMIEQAGLSGFMFDQVEISKSEIFEELHPDQALPNFVWLKVNGLPRQHDFGVTLRNELVVSERALQVLKEARLSHAEIVELK
jgi:hypothetical protein